MNPAIGISVVLAISFLAGELYFFLMQRSALEVCRAAGLPEDLRFVMLPASYRAARLVTIGKWIALVGVGVYGGWWLAFGIWVISFIASSAVPVPHGTFFPMFYDQLSSTSSPEDQLRVALTSALEAIDRRQGITGQPDDRKGSA